MIASISGILEVRGADSIVVDVGGVGLRAHVPASTLARLGAVGDDVRLHTHLYVREDLLALYGFATEDELRTFELLISVTGVGPRSALALLSGVSVEALRRAIASENPDGLTIVPGIGKKLAGRIVLELKGKIEVVGPSEATAAPSGTDAEVLAALVGLGYTAADAQTAIRSLPSQPGQGTEERILQALRHFAR